MRLPLYVARLCLPIPIRIHSHTFASNKKCFFLLCILYASCPNARMWCLILQLVLSVCAAVVVVGCRFFVYFVHWMFLFSVAFIDLALSTSVSKTWNRFAWIGLAPWILITEIKHERKNTNFQIAHLLDFFAFFFLGLLTVTVYKPISISLHLDWLLIC